MTKNTIGHFRDDQKTIAVDLDALIESRLMIQASSGGGKSNAIRMIAEAAGGKIQTLIIDREGELHTLREKVDLLVVGESGVIPANPRNAGELAVELLKSGVSAVIDLLGVSPRDQKLYVRRFVENLNAAPRALWHPVLVVIDEAHVFCPEHGQGDAESGEAIELLMSAGRKRGYCGILATQRMSCLSKTAAAEAHNKLIGLCNLDVDYKRAGAEIGLAREECKRLMQMELGQFYVRGPAFGIRGGFRDVQLNAAGTRPPKRGSHAGVAKPSAEILAKLPALEAIGQNADPNDVNTIDAARERIKALNQKAAVLDQKLKAAERAAGQANLAAPSKPIDLAAVIAKAKAEERASVRKGAAGMLRELARTSADVAKLAASLNERVGSLVSSVGSVTTLLEAPAAPVEVVDGARAMNQPIHDELQKTCAMIADATGGLVMIAMPSLGVTVAATPSSGTPIVEAAMGFCMIEDVLCYRIKHAREAYTAHGGTADEFDRILARTREKIGLDPDRGSFLSRSWVRPDATRGGGHGSGEGAPS